MNIKSANELLTNRVKPEHLVSKEMVDDDLWLDGKGLIVKKPNDSETKQKMKEDFNTQNALAEVVGRREDGLLGRDPNWTIVRKDGAEMSDKEIELVKQMDNALIKFWNDRQMTALMRQLYRNALSLVIDELHPYVPPAYKDADGYLVQETDKNFEECLEMLYFERVKPEDAGVFVNKSSQKPYSVYRYTKENKSFVDFSFVDADGITHFNTFEAMLFDRFLEKFFPTSLNLYTTKQTGEKQTGEQAIDLGGKLMLFELNLGEPFITDAMKRNQLGISLAKTMKGRNTYTGGFRSHHFLGVEKPKVKIDDPDKPGSQKEVSKNVPVGPGVSTFTKAADIHDANGKPIGRGNVSLVVVDPVSTVTFVESKNEDYYSILAAASQTHVLNADSVAISGVSRKDSRSEHEKKLKKDKTPLDACGRYIVEFSMAFAAAICGKEKDFEPYRVDFNCIVDAGLPTTEEKEDNRKAHQAGEISLITLMSRNGVEDPDAELAAIKKDDGYEFNLLARAAKAYSEANGAVPLNLFIKMLPFDEKKKTELLAMVVEPKKPEEKTTKQEETLNV